MKPDIESDSNTPKRDSQIDLHSKISQYKSRLLNQISIPKIRLSYQPEVPVEDRIKILHSKHAAEILRQLWNPDTFEIQEQFGVLMLNNANKILGFYPISIGGLTSTIVDIRLIFIAALNCGAVGIIACHNHPSGSKRPSISDRELTHKICKAGESIDIKLLDHIILTQDDYYSFADNGEI